MKRTLFALSFALPLLVAAQDTLNRLPIGIVTFSGVDTVNVTKYQGKVFFNDPSGVFKANQIAVNDRVYVPSGATYTVDSVWGASLFDANIRMVQNSGVAAKPSGKGFVTRPTKNYGLPMVPPDNDAGISPQMHALIMSNLAFKVDSLMRDSLLNLRDVAISSPANNAFFVFDSTAGKWKDTIVAVPTGVAAPNTQSSGQVAYFSGNDTLSGENDLFWDASNNRLGIGTTTPTHMVEIKSPSVLAALKINNATTASGKVLLARADTVIWSLGSVGSNDNFNIYNSVDTIYALSVQKVGSRVGISTSTPQERLHVVGRVRIDTLTATPTRVVGADVNGTLGEMTTSTFLNLLPKRSLLDTLPLGNVTIDANTYTLRFDSMTNFSAMLSGTGSVAQGRPTITTLGASPRNKQNNGLVVTPTSGAYLHYTDTTNYGQVLAGSDRAQMIAANSTFTTSLIQAGTSNVSLIHYKSSGNPGTQVSLTNDTLNISADSAVLINNVKQPTSAPASDGNKYIPVWRNGQPAFERRVSSTTLTSGAVTAVISLLGSGTPTISNLSAGIYKVTIPTGVDIRGLVVTANNTVLSGSNEFTLIVDNVANSIDQWYNVQVYDISTNSFVDQHATSTNHTQAVASNATTMVFPGMNLFGSTGFRLILR